MSQDPPINRTRPVCRVVAEADRGTRVVCTSVKGAVGSSHAGGTSFCHAGPGLDSDDDRQQLDPLQQRGAFRPVGRESGDSSVSSNFGSEQEGAERQEARRTW